MSDFDIYVGLEFERPSDATAWLDVRADLSPAHRRRVEAWIDQWTTKLGYAFIEDLNRDRDAIAEHYGRNEEAIREGSRRAADIRAQVSSGRLDPNKALKELGRLSAAHQEALAVRASLEDASERWEKRASADGEAHLDEMRARFTATKWSRVLTHGYLIGKEPSPFLNADGA